MTTATTIKKTVLAKGGVVLHAVSWKEYERVGQIFRDRPIRLTYDQGTLEIMTTSFRHERRKALLRKMIDALAEEMRIDIASSKWPYTGISEGSTLFLDRLALKSILVNVENMNQANANLISSFPNPAKDVLNISFKKSPTSDFDLMVYNLLGGLVKSERYSHQAKSFQLRIADLAPGTYYFKCISKDEQFQSSFVKE